MESNESNFTKLNVVDLEGKAVGSIECPLQLENLYVCSDLLYKVINALIHNSKRVNSSHYKNLTCLTGSNRKILVQKGTGKARRGMLRALRMRGGAVKFGYSGDKEKDAVKRYKAYIFINKKEARKATLGIIANKLRNGCITIVDSFAGIDKTKFAEQAVKAVTRLENFNGSIIYTDYDQVTPFRNLKNINLFNVEGLNSYKLITKERVIFEKQAMIKLLDKLIK